MCLAVACLAAPACEDESGLEIQLLEDDGATLPWQGSWRVVHVGPFDAGDGTPIETITIGSVEGFAGNFVNRGDVIVDYGGAPDEITIEMRPFAHAATSPEADTLLERISPWAYAGATSSPLPPEEMDDATRCIGIDDGGSPLPWRDDCAIYVFFAGGTQPLRTGADIRVTLPASYRGRVDVRTADNAAFDTYRDRSNVCVRDTPGQVDVELAAGVAWVTVAAAQPVPLCPAASVTACELWDDAATPGPDPWNADCPCFADGYETGLVRIESTDDAPMNATVQVPDALWTSFSLTNDGDNALAGRHCVADLEGLADVIYDDSGADPSKPWLAAGIVNQPPGAPAAGFRVRTRSSGCDDVMIDATAEERRAGAAPRSERRGDLLLCTDCLRDLDCAAMLGD